MASGLHTDVIAFATDYPALTISKNILEQQVLASVRTAGDVMFNNSVDTGLAGVQCRLTQKITDLARLKVDYVEVSGYLKLRLNTDISFVLTLHVNGDAALSFSTLQFDISKIAFPLRGFNTTLTVDEAEFVVSVSLTKTATRANAETAAGVTDKEIERLEGALQYFLKDTVATNILVGKLSLNLKELYPSLSWVGGLDFKILGKHLVVKPTSRALIADQDNCHCPRSIPGADVTLGGGTATPHGASADFSWDFSVTWPPPPAINISTKDCDIGIYLPVKSLAARFDKVFPAFYIPFGDPGFLGYEGGVSLIFENIADPLVDAARNGVVLAADITMTGQLRVVVNAGCAGSHTVAHTVKFEVAASKIKLLLRPAYNNGVVTLKSDIDELTLGEVTVEIIMFGAWLAFAGGAGAVFGFILDRIGDKILRHNVPIKLRESVYKSLDNATFPLIDLTPHLPKIPNSQHYVSTYSGASRSVLLGCGPPLGADEEEEADKT